MDSAGALFYQLELFLAGTAVVLDSALLIIVFERINRPFVALWLKYLILGTISFHVGYFGRVLIWNVESTKAISLDHFMMCLIVLGLLLLPSSMLHSAIRMWHTGLDSKPSRDWRYGLLYLPLVLAPILFARIFVRPDRLFLESIAWFTPTYLVWLLVSNGLAIGFLLVFTIREEVPRPFLIRLVASVLLVCVGAITYSLLSSDPQWEPTLRLSVCMSPLIPEGVFVWYTLKQRVLPLVLDRTLLYAVSLTLGLLLHQLIISPVASAVRETSNIDLSILEAILIIGVLLLVPPLRKRCREALRYLFSTNVFHVRDATRLLSVTLSQQANREPHSLSQWFANELADKLDLDKAVILISPDTLTFSQALAFESERKEPVRSSDMSEDQLNDWLCIAKSVQHLDRLDRGMLVPQSIEMQTINASMAQSLHAMERQGILVAFRLSFLSVHGAVLLGDRKRNDRLADEQMIAIALLCDQLAATLGNKYESIRRLQAERRMMQNEKLSTLGLIAGSLAHELRNPLSSIRTIAALTMEELGPEHSNRQDLAIIVSEIDKLTQTTTRLLDSARPADGESNAVSPDLVISKLLTLLTPLAKQLHVDLHYDLQCPNCSIDGSEASLSEVFFNLIKNGIEAATGRPNAWVKITSRENKSNAIEVVVSDNGPGITDALLEKLFEPFVTGKASGTGLGLFVVSERIKEIKGTISCERYPESNATQFLVKIPICGIARKYSTGDSPA